ncbi:MAG: hypothetical protein JG718_02110 [Candidatus Thiothrix moscowensis]|nr:hypothetical protein [Candidatus Thiothrix moscowensis]
MLQDPIVEEIHRIREEYAKRLGYDLHKICEEMHQRQLQAGRKAVTRMPRKPRIQPQVA